MSDKAVFLDLDDRHWEYVAREANEAGLSVEKWIEKFIKDAVEHGVPTMKVGSAKADLPNDVQLRQVSHGIDKNALVAAFVKEGESRRLYFKREGRVVPTYAHIVIGITPGSRTVWDARGQWNDVQQMTKDMLYERPGNRQSPAYTTRCRALTWNPLGTKSTS